jgi:uncharacterized protein (TIGR03086 family)
VDPVQSLSAAFDEAVAVVRKVKPDQWTLQSPCSEWDVRGVVSHMTVGAQMVAACVSGKEFTPGADALGNDPAGALRAAADVALEAFKSDPLALGRVIKMPFGEMPGAVVAGIFTNDEFAHAWDVAKATGQSTDLNPAMAERCLAAAQQFITPDLRTHGLFDAEKKAPSLASAADRLAAFMGRQV